MNFNRIILTLTTCLIFMLSGCAGYRSTQFEYGTIKTGMDKAEIIQKYGSPFKADVKQENGQLNEMLRYKEAVDVGLYTYILTTDLYFLNSKLIKIEQQESDPPGSNVVVEKN